LLPSTSAVAFASVGWLVFAAGAPGEVLDPPPPPPQLANIRMAPTATIRETMPYDMSISTYVM
jgi:hypothetical protein